MPTRRRQNLQAAQEAEEKRRARAAKKAKRGGKVIRGGQVVQTERAVEVPTDPDVLAAMGRDDFLVLVDDAVEAYFTPGVPAPGRAEFAHLLREALIRLVEENPSD